MNTSLFSRLLHFLTYTASLIHRQFLILPLLLVLILLPHSPPQLQLQAQSPPTPTATPGPLRITFLSFNTFTLAWDDITGNKNSDDWQNLKNNNPPGTLWYHWSGNPPEFH